MLFKDIKKIIMCDCKVVYVDFEGVHYIKAKTNDKTPYDDYEVSRINASHSCVEIHLKNDLEPIR